ncbi:MAG: hypothetical protein OEW67_07825 [Cyclobacteriaceae bacterium]|nr:hypothetical protein [Cyclobacteriaceae bacterium]
MLKKSFYFSLIISITCILGCTSNSEHTEEISDEASSEMITEKESKVSLAVCVWDKVSVREAPGDKAKWVTSLSIGESLSYLNVDSILDKKTYSKVLLNDSKEGWTRKDFIVVDAKPAVVLGDVDLYSRPDLLTKTDKKFSMMDIISSVEQQDDWMKVRGKRDEGTWIEDGWVKAQHISFEPVDIATAKFAKQALKLEDQNKKVEAINEIINNPDLSASKFIANLEELITELNTSEKLVEVIEEIINEEQTKDSIF